MLTKAFPFLDPAGITPDLINRLRSLSDACADLRQNRAVPPILLQAAPKLDAYAPVVTPQGLRLVGEVSGHPLLPGRGRRIITSQVWLADPAGHWVRTLSRYYRLGRSITPDDLLRHGAASRNPFDDVDWDSGGHA